MTADLARENLALLVIALGCVAAYRKDPNR